MSDAKSRRAPIPSLPAIHVSHPDPVRVKDTTMRLPSGENAKLSTRGEYGRSAQASGRATSSDFPVATSISHMAVPSQYATWLLSGRHARNLNGNPYCADVKISCGRPSGGETT